MSTSRHLADILELFISDSELGVREMGRRLGISKSRAHRLASELASLDLLAKDCGSGRYRLGFRVIELGILAQARNDLANVAKPVLASLMRRTQENAYLGVLHGCEFFALEQAWTYPAIRWFSPPMVRVPPHYTSAGKVLLAYNNEIADHVIEIGLTAATPKTITDPRHLRKHLGLIREQGYAVSLEEGGVGWRSVAAPVQVNGDVVAAISVGGPSNRMPTERLRALVVAVTEAASELERALRRHSSP